MLNSGQASGSSAQQQQLAVGQPCCCRCGAAGTSSGWCCGCGVALLQHMQGCLAELLAVPGAAELLLTAGLAQAQQLSKTGVDGPASIGSSTAQPAAAAGVGCSSASDGAGSAASLLLDDAWQQLPGPTQQLLQLVLPAARDGTLLQSLSNSSSLSQPQLGQQESSTHPLQLQQQEQEQVALLKRSEPGSIVPASSATAAAAAAAAAVPAVLWSWGLWCMLLMLVLAQVRGRVDGHVACNTHMWVHAWLLLRCCCVTQPKHAVLRYVIARLV
jgi:hypothetical protein